MGKRLNIPQPAVINTELAPFDENFEVVANGQLEQWYYDNDNTYAPNRTITPLILTPTITVYDPDNRRTFSPAFSTVAWFSLEYNSSTGTFVETRITNVDDSAVADYVIVGNTLKIKKNVSYTRAVQIKCVANYIDPRDSGITYTVEYVTTLSTNRNATVEYPKLDIATPRSLSFNPLTDDTSQFSLTAMAMQGGNDVTDNLYYVWYAVSNGVEVLADTMLWYVSGQNTKTLVVDALYGDDIQIVLRAKGSVSEASLYPSRANRSIMWVIPDIDTNVLSENGGAVRADTEQMSFDVIVNVKGRQLTDEKIAEHLRFNWKYRQSTLSTENDAGWGRRITIDASNLRNVYGSGTSLASTIVFPYVYLMGAYEIVTHNNETVTHNNETVYARSMFD